MNRKLIILLMFVFIALYGCKDNKKCKVTLIEIMSSSSCEECVTTYKPMVDELKKEFTKDVKFLIYDTGTDEGVKMANKYGVTKLPTFIFLDKEGVEYFRMKDIIIKDAMAAIINAKLNESNGNKR
ncbi:MAG: thioredoxin family protein [Candidatus Goldbacteria bacterium]|nr:thioredoxin family protein [Candidatus Goldiibacteriota bacterium]